MDNPNMAQEQQTALAALLDDLTLAPPPTSTQPQSPAPDTAAPSPQPQGVALTVPTAWRELFNGEHADKEVYSRLLPTCRAGKDWALQTAPKLGVTVTLPGQNKSLRLWDAQLAAIGAALSTRGKAPTSLTVLPCEDDAELRPAALASIAEAVRKAGAGEGIGELRLQPMKEGGFAEALPLSAFLNRMATTCPNLTTLHLDYYQGSVPTPDKMPKLTALTVKTRSIEHHIHSSIAPYLNQLTSLTVNITTGQSAPPAYISWSVLFPQSKSKTLTHFKTNQPLDQYLIANIVHHAPALTHLHVACVPDNIEHHANGTWAVKHLEMEAAASLATLAQLPKLDKEGKMHISMPGVIVLDVDTVEGIHVANRLSEWHFPSTDYVEVTLTNALSAADLPMALRNTLRQLRDMEAPKALLQLLAWQWTPGLLEIVAEEIPLLGHLNMWINILDALTDELLGSLLRIAPHIHIVCASSLEVRSGQFKETPWPWTEVHFGLLEASGLLRLPQPSTLQECIPNLVCGTLDLSEVDVACDEAVKGWLQGVSLWINHPGEIILSAPIDASAAVLLAVQLAVLPTAVRLLKPTIEPCAVLACPMTVDVMETLRALPEWITQVDLTSCSWPLEPNAYRQLALCIPVHVRKWRFGYISRHIVGSIETGIREHRGPGLPFVTLVYLGMEYEIK